MSTRETIKFEFFGRESIRRRDGVIRVEGEKKGKKKRK